MLLTIVFTPRLIRYVTIIRRLHSAEYHRVKVRRADRQKKTACPARGPKQDRKILRRCTSRSPYKPRGPPGDRVAVL